jgi:hypothetical protein
MSRHPIAIPLALVMGVWSYPISWAQAQNSVQIPAQQRQLTSILSKYNDLHESAPNNIQRDKIDLDFRRVFCAAIPKGEVSGWIGEIESIDNDTPDKAIRLSMEVSTQDLISGGLGIELSLGNYYAYGVDDKNTQPHGSTVIPVSSPLYNAVSMLRNGDTVIFSGTFIPYSSQQACYDSISYATYFSLFRFSSVRKIGWGITF